MADLTGIQPPPNPAGRGNQRAVTHGLFVKAPAGLRLRTRRVSRLVRRMKKVMPWLDPADEPTCRAWAELEILATFAAADLMKKGIVVRGGEPRRLMTEFRMLRTAQLAYADKLGMTPAARMALRVGDSRGRAFDAAARVGALRAEVGQ